MITPKTGTRISLKNIMFLTDFSESSEAALPFAVAMARAFGAKVHALHVLLPEPSVYTMPEMTEEALEAEEENARAGMQSVESYLDGTTHHSYIVRDVSVRQAVQQIAKEIHADLIVMGTHGRTGPQKMLFGSIAEDIFRHSRIPVLTIGPKVRPAHNGAHFKSVLFAADFTPESQAAAPYAASLAEENDSRLILLNVIPGKERDSSDSAVIAAQHWLHQMIPADAEFWCHPEIIVENGDAPVRILELAGKRSADLIVLGVRNADKLGASTHLGGSVAHEVVTHARCPVLTVRQ